MPGQAVGCRYAAAVPEPTDAPTVDETLASTLDSLDGAVNYRNWIFDLARPYLESPVLEVGAGHGTFTGLLAELGSVTAVEPGERMGALLREMYGADPRVAVEVGVVDDLPAGPHFGSAVMINVLEHIADDAGALRSIRERLLPGAHLVLWVPAFPSLYSRFDELLGHERRYRLRGLRSVVEGTGLTVVEARYVNSVGWFSWLVVARLLGRIPTSGAAVGVFDKAVVPVVRRAEHGVRPPFGQSILLVARKPLDDGTR